MYTKRSLTQHMRMLAGACLRLGEWAILKHVLRGREGGRDKGRVAEQGSQPMRDLNVVVVAGSCVLLSNNMPACPVLPHEGMICWHYETCHSGPPLKYISEMEALNSQCASHSRGGGGHRDHVRRRRVGARCGWRHLATPVQDT